MLLELPLLGEVLVPLQLLGEVLVPLQLLGEVVMYLKGLVGQTTVLIPILARTLKT
jgi:hypothetical protein